MIGVDFAIIFWAAIAIFGAVMFYAGFQLGIKRARREAKRKGFDVLPPGPPRE